MVTHLRMKCPRCHQECEIYLSNDATFVILNCPECSSPLMYHDQDCSVLSRKQILKIRDAHPNLKLGEVLERHSYAVSPGTQRRELASVSAHRSPGRVGRDESRQTICHDDVTNLQIELAMCSDSREFIDRM